MAESRSNGETSVGVFEARSQSGEHTAVRTIQLYLPYEPLTHMCCLIMYCIYTIDLGAVSQ